MSQLQANVELTVRDQLEPLPYFDRSGLVIQFTGFEGLPNTFSPNDITLEVGNANNSPYSNPVFATVTYTAVPWYIFTGTPVTNFILPYNTLKDYVVTVNKTVASKQPIGIYESTITVNFGSYGIKTCTIRLKVLPAPTSYITIVDREYPYAFKTQEILNEYPDHYSPKQIKDSVVSKVFNASAGLDLEDIENKEFVNFFTQRHMSLAQDTPLETMFLYNLEQIPVKKTANNLITNGGFHLATNPYQFPNYWIKKVEFVDIAPAYQLVNFDTHDTNLKSTGIGVLKLKSHYVFTFGESGIYQTIDVSSMEEKNFSINVWYKRSTSNVLPTNLYYLYTIMTFDDSTIATIKNRVALTDSTTLTSKTLKISSLNKIKSIQVGIEYTNLVSIDPQLGDSSTLEVHALSMLPTHNAVTYTTNENDKPLWVDSIQDGIGIIHGNAAVYQIDQAEITKQLLPSSITVSLRDLNPTLSTNRNRVGLPNVVFSTGASYPQELVVVNTDAITEYQLPADYIGRCIAVRADNKEVRHSYRLGFTDIADDSKIVIAPDACQIEAITEDLVGGLWGVARITNFEHMPVTKRTQFMLFAASKQIPKPPTHYTELDILNYPSYIQAKSVYHIPVYDQLVYAKAVQIEKLDKRTMALAFDNGMTLIIYLKFYYYVTNSGSKQIAILDNLHAEYPTSKTIFV